MRLSAPLRERSGVYAWARTNKSKNGILSFPKTLNPMVITTLCLNAIFAAAFVITSFTVLCE
jgi:hypothetical protein